MSNLISGQQTKPVPPSSANSSASSVMTSTLGVAVGTALGSPLAITVATRLCQAMFSPQSPVKFLNDTRTDIEAWAKTLSPEAYAYLKENLTKAAKYVATFNKGEPVKVAKENLTSPHWSPSRGVGKAGDGADLSPAARTLASKTTNPSASNTLAQQIGGGQAPAAELAQRGSKTGRTNPGTGVPEPSQDSKSGGVSRLSPGQAYYLASRVLKRGAEGLIS